MIRAKGYRSVMAGRDAALRRPDGAARRSYLSRPPSLTDCVKKQLALIGRCIYIARPFGKKGQIMRRPKGIKTRKAVAKRFKITARGKVMRMRAGKRHLLQTKNPKRRRSLGTSKLVDPTDTYRILQNLPFSH
jgi:large subunit ribosomal protein L35